MVEFEEKYVEMHIDEMKAVKESWQRFLKMARNNLRHVLSLKETKENRWELLSLEKHYDYCLDAIKKILAIYSELINLGEDCDLEENYFIKRIKEIQRIHKDLHKEFNNKKMKILEMKYIEGLRPAETINI